MSSIPRKLPVATLEKIDNWCAQFENVWQNGARPRMEDWLAFTEEPTEREVLFRELLALDLDYRRKAGEVSRPEDYVERFPNEREWILDLLKESQPKKPSSRFEVPTIERMSELFPSLDVIELIGTGGMGAVYKARQKGLDRLVAIKILPDEISHESKFALRFTREARALARLNHANIVSVFEFGDSGGTYYFLMEYVDGPTLRELIGGGELKPEQALAIVPHLCDALQYAHDQGVVHRDIKPENILIDKKGKVKIADFGLAQLIGNEANELSLTGTHQVMGTLRYMAPEQMEHSHTVDHRADIYSLGVVFYEMLTRELPIGRFAVPSEKVNIDVRLDKVVLRTLEKEPQLRYQRASHVKTDIELIAGSAETPQATREFRSSSHADTKHYDKNPSVASDEKLPTLVKEVTQALNPLKYSQVLQLLFGIAIAGFGIYTWSKNPEDQSKFISGIVLQVFGTLSFIAAARLCVKINQLAEVESLSKLESQLDDIFRTSVYGSMAIGAAWWVMWLPVMIAIGATMFSETRNMLPILVGCLLGLFCTWAIAWPFLSKDLRSENKPGKLGGKSLGKAYMALKKWKSSR